MSKSTKERALQQYADALREVMKEPIGASEAMDTAMEAYEDTPTHAEQLCKFASMIYLLEDERDSARIALGRKLEAYRRLDKALQDTQAQLSELKKGIISLRRHLCGQVAHDIDIQSVLEKLNEILPVDLRHELFEEQPKPEVQP